MDYYHGMQPVDFIKLIQDIKANGGFEDYPVPLGPDVSTLEMSDYVRTKVINPRHMGEMAYGNGPQRIGDGFDIPQKLINAQNTSIKDALNVYMPTSVLQQFMCTYFRGDFINDVYFAAVPKQTVPSIDITTKRAKRAPNAPWVYTLNLETDERKSLSRHYFTEIETHLIRSIVKTRPELLAVTIAYQACAMAFLDKLQDAFKEDASLSDAERERGLKIQRVLQSNWTVTSNFAQEIIPAICLAYYRRDPSLKSEPTSGDFEKGIRFAMRIGVFQRHCEASDDPIRKFTCPAMGTILGASVIAVKGETCTREAADKAADKAKGPTMGGMFAMIYQQVKKADWHHHPATQIDYLSHHRARATLMLGRAFPTRLIAYVAGT